ncbi:MAG: hypothetical protein ACP5N9_03240 [Candidatus Bilamarchaeum sp.]|jgi:uncharacterized protein related to proFAR isomerase
MLQIPLIYLKDKQVFASPNLLRTIGKPIDVVKELHNEGYKLIHIVDLDALKGLSTNMDVYDKLTFFVNIQVECTANEKLLQKLLSVKARVVLNSASAIVSKFEEKKLLVVKVKSISDDASLFHDVIIDNEDEKGLIAKHFEEAKKRIIVFENNKHKKSKLWGKIIAYPSV